MDYTSTGETPPELMSWNNTFYNINGKAYWKVRSFNPPSPNSSNENIYGMGSTPVGWGRGNKEIPNGSMAMLLDDWYTLKIDLTGGDVTVDVTTIPFTVVEQITPAQGGENSQITTTYSNVRIAEVQQPERTQGATNYEVTLTLQFPSEGVESITNPTT